MESIREGIDLVNIKLIKDKRLVYKENLSTPIAAVNAMYDFMQDLDREVVAVINLDAKFKPINANIVSIGDMKSSVANIGMMVKTSILSNAVNIISIHNHPSSGDPNPSYEDKKVFRKLRDVCELISINLADNIIVGENRVYSEAMDNILDIDEFEIQESKVIDNTNISMKINTISELMNKYFLLPSTKRISSEERKRDSFDMLSNMVNDISSVIGNNEIVKDFENIAREEGYIVEPKTGYIKAGGI